MDIEQCHSPRPVESIIVRFGIPDPAIGSVSDIPSIPSNISDVLLVLSAQNSEGVRSEGNHHSKKCCSPILGLRAQGLRHRYDSGRVI